MGLSKDLLVFDTADASGSDNVGAYLLAGTDGDAIESTIVNSKESLNVAAAMFSGAGVAITETSGALDVNISNAADINVQIDSEYAEDSAFTDLDIGMHMLSVRQDSISSSTSTDGDYASFKSTASGRIYVDSEISGSSGDLSVVGNVADDAADSGSPVKIGSRALDGASALSAISGANDRADAVSDLYRRLWVNDSANVGVASVEVSVATTETAVPATELAGRKLLILQNQSNTGSIFVGPTGVTISTGLEIPKRGSLEIPAGEGIALFGIVSSGTSACRVFELG